MKTFIQRFGQSISGILHGFDRIRFRGTRRFLANTAGMMNFLWQRQILLKDFKEFAGNLTAQIRRAAEAQAVQEQRPVQYLRTSVMNKEAWARQVAQRDGIGQGLIGVLKSVERCWSYQVGPNRDRQRLELRGGPSKCLHYYHYFQNPEVGLLYVRLQTWFPFSVHIGMNGREWLARQMDRVGMKYCQRDNCFTWIQDWTGSQQLLHQQLRTDWSALLDGLLHQANPALVMVDSHPTPYYWSLEEGEWASDLAFASSDVLAKLSPRLFRHAYLGFASGDVMRFLGRKGVSAQGPHGNFTGEVITDLKRRPEGMRVKHRLNRNWIKMYDKQGSVLRVETVINDPRDMKVYRTNTKEGNPSGEKTWQRLRKGVADIHRRAQISQAANERYVEALATVDDSRSLAELAQSVCQPVWWQGKRARALNPLASEDARLLEAVNRGEFAINGFRNRDLRILWFPTPPSDPLEQRRRSGAISRKLRLLRAHGLIHKVPKTHRYQISPHGREIINALLIARQASTAKLTLAA
jgi:hypothetical protein